MTMYGWRVMVMAIMCRLMMGIVMRWREMVMEVIM